MAADVRGLSDRTLQAQAGKTAMQRYLPVVAVGRRTAIAALPPNRALPHNCGPVTRIETGESAFELRASPVSSLRGRLRR